MTYSEASQYIGSLAQRGWRLGLDRMQEFARIAELDASGPAFFHVAGTNGKGTTTAFIQSILIEHGYRTGAFFSPYVYDPRERVQFGRELISELDFARLTTSLKVVADEMESTPFDGPTEFEFKTALGLAYWAEKQCDAVALEVGLGGRLDATNIVSPRSTCIVSIGLDHVSILGDTLTQIAAEKGGIIKAGIPVVIGEMPDEAVAVIQARSESVGAPFFRIGRDFTYTATSVSSQWFEVDGLEPSLRGSRMAHNMAVAIATLAVAPDFELSAESVRRGVARAVCPGRYERRMLGENALILDGAHNLDSSKALAASLLADNVEPGSLVLITNMLRGHDASEFYEPLREFIKQIFVVPIDFPRALEVAEMAHDLRAAGFNVRAFDLLSNAIEEVRSSPAQTFLITGSFYLLGDWNRATI